MNQFRHRKSKEAARPQKRKRWLSSAADWITLKLGLEERLTPVALARILWVGMLAVVYIYFQHNFDRLIRNTEKAEKVLEEKRAMYISHKANYLFASKQSEIEKKLEGKGFTNAQSPIKISMQNPK
ncbi:FtsL-like putative cell division protein [Leadbetterella sp. DM7]|uniref:FtsL-like putative cell division protein n=1 Tax=Leadbetterella sp. DM7 TaxID=3235085 RepID=UPI00349E94CD